MKTVFIISLLCYFTFPIFAQNQLEGTWDTGKHNTLIQIFPSADGGLGKVISSDSPKAKKDDIVIKNLEMEGSHWKGQFYIPPLDSWQEAKFEPSGKSAKVTVKVGWLKKSIEWERVK